MLMNSPNEMHAQSSNGGYPYNGGGNANPKGGVQPMPSTINPVGLAGGSGASGGLNSLKRPGALTSAVPGQVGPNPMPPSMRTAPPAPAFGGMTNPDMNGPQPGGPLQSPVNLGPPISPRPAMPQVAPPMGLQPTPPPQRSAGFGGIRPNMAY